MENKNYYPLRVGKHSSCIVSDMPVTHRNKKDMDAEFEHYGGFVIAESIPAEIAKEFVDLFNKKYGCPAGIEMKPCTGGQMCCQGKISHHEWMEQESRLKSNFRLPYEEIDPFESMSKNSAHSFTEGADHDGWSSTDIDGQIAFIGRQPKTPMLTAIYKSLESIKRWNESPAYHGKVDVEKVIGDLLFYAKYFCEESGHSRESALSMEANDHVQNAEAALGMLQAFKQERHQPPESIRQYVKKKPTHRT